MMTQVQEKKKINFYIISKNNTLKLWLKSSLKLTNIAINSIQLCTISSLEYSTFDANQLNVILCGESIYTRLTKKLIQLYPNAQYNCSILVLTDSIDNSSIKTLQYATIDTIPWSNLTIFLLEHLLRSLIQDYIQNRKLQNLAHYDPLTNAANRRLFEDRANQVIKRAKRFKEPISLLYFDLDGFKNINDNLGHDIGDLLLIKFVNLLTGCCRTTDILARLGGDEFVLLLPNTSHKSLILVIEKITTVLLSPYFIGQHLIEIKASIGAVSVGGEFLTSITLNKLLKSADKSVYQAKKINGTATHFAEEYSALSHQA